MPIPTELVGSLPRPEKLQNAYQDLDDGKITWEELQALQDEAAEDSIKRLEATGEPIVTDGEQRESSFATYPITDTLAGTGLGDNLAGDGQFFAIFDDGHHRQLPRLTGGPFRYKTYASEFVEKNRRIATHDVKQAVIAPSMLMLLYPLEGEIEGYSRDQFLSDLCDEVEKDIRQCFAAGAVRVSVDFTEGRLANKNDSRNPWTGKNMLQEFIDLNNRVFDRFSAEERRNIGIHTCPGGDNDSVHSKEVPYEKLLSKMFEINAGYFLIQCASEQDKEEVYRLCGQYSREDADGVAQVCFMGVINPLSPEVETPEQVKNDLLTAAKHIPVERLGATDDCGFSPFSRDLKPKHGSPDFARDVAMQKISARLEGARMASDELGV
jgi:methionine synthase II (cobalamin-independent)